MASSSSSRPRMSYPLMPDEIVESMKRLNLSHPTAVSDRNRLTKPSPADLQSKPLPPIPQSLIPGRPPHLAGRPNPYDTPVPLPRPPAVNIPPTSLLQRPVLTGVAHSDEILSTSYPSSLAQFPSPHPPPPARPAINSIPYLYPVSPARYALAPPSPSSSRHVRAASAPPLPTDKVSSGTFDNGVQCSGMTKAGKRCTRIVKSAHPYTVAMSSRDVERFCFQHTKDVLEPTGFYPQNKSVWVDFDDWIPSHLSADTRAALRIEMEKAPSAADVSGYIYAYEIRDPNTPGQVHIKVGRAVNMIKRLDEWSKQCESREVILRGWWPGKVVDNEGTGPSLLKGRIQAGPKGKYCHRLERLIHLELSDLMVNESYLEPDFTKNGKITASPSKKSSLAKKPPRKKCPDCGSVHKEIFTFARVPKGSLKGHEWDRIVQPVIERWGKFVETYL